MTDYYSILGLQRGASIEEVKKAYKTLAKKYHPDVSKEADAEKKFKEIVEAYSILSDQQKKENYDKFGDSYKNFQGGGHQGFGGGMDFDFEDIFSQFGGGGMDFGDLFGFGGGKRGKQKDNGENIRYNMTLTFEEAVFGVEKEISYDRIEKCEKCNGTGAKNSKLKTCHTCNGQGRVVRQQRTPFGVFQSQSVCHACAGSGETAEEKCHECNASGLIADKYTVTVKVPAGINTGNHLRLEGKGHAGRDGAGDLYIVIMVGTHEIFKRDEYDIYAEIPISFTESALGAQIDVPTLRGRADLKVPAGTQTGTIFRLKDKGIKNIDSNSFGDEYIKVIVETPKKLSKKQKELLEKLAREEAASKKRKSIIDKLFK